MKPDQIKFFSPEDNSESKQKTKAKPVSLTGYVSPTGKLVFPAKTIAQLAFDPENSQFKIGTQDGKRKIKSLYLIPDADGESESFSLEKAAKSYTISLAVILQRGKIDYAKNKYAFTINPFEYQSGVTGYELQLADQSPKAPYTGKPRGRKSQANAAAE